jgi:hypothetical protein
MRNTLLASLLLVSALVVGCDGSDTALYPTDMSAAGSPESPAVVTKGKTAGDTSSSAADTTSASSGSGSSTTQASIAGTWTGSDADGSMTLVLKAGGTGTYSFTYTGGGSKSGNVTWTGSGTTYAIVFDPGVDAYTMPAVLSGSSLSVTSDGETVVLSKS